jgi:hypothetical protein
MWCDLNNKNLLQKKFNILGLGNQRVKTYGCTNIKMNINNNIYKLEMHVVQHENSDYEGLLGINFLQKYKAVIDIAKHELILQGRRVPLVKSYHQEHQDVAVNIGIANQSSPAIKYSALKSNKPLTITPGSARITLLPVSELDKNNYITNNNKNLLVEPLEINQALDKDRIYVARTISPIIKKSCGGKYCNVLCTKCKYFVPVQLTNFNTYNVHVIKGTLVARTIAVQDSDIMSSDCLSVDMNKNNKQSHVYNIINEEDNDSDEKNFDEILLDKKLSHLPLEIREQYKDLILNEFPDVFIEKKIRQGTSLTQHTIKLSSNDIAYTRPYKISVPIQPYADELFGKQIESRTIEPSISPHNSGILLVKKKSPDGSIKYRGVLDLRKINSLTVPDPYPLLNIQDSINHLSKCKYFTTLDLKD